MNVASAFGIGIASGPVDRKRATTSSGKAGASAARTSSSQLLAAGAGATRGAPASLTGTSRR